MPARHIRMDISRFCRFVKSRNKFARGLFGLFRIPGGLGRLDFARQGFQAGLDPLIVEGPSFRLSRVLYC